MFVELIDRLRCPNDHGETWLVAAASRTEHRRLVEATLACPVCDAEFVVHGGAVRFGAGVPGTPMAAGSDDLMRAAALLHLQERGLFLLEGGWGSLASGLLALMQADFLLVDPPADVAVDDGAGTLLGVADRWPLAASSLQGIALQHATPARLAGAVRVLASRGRLVAPADVPTPVGIAELARDEHHWVGEKFGDVVRLARASK